MTPDQLKQWLYAFWTWVVANPVITAPVVGALLTFILKPRTPEQYAEIAKRSPRWAAFRQFLGTIFPDLVKAKKVFFKIIYGTEDPLAPKLIPFFIVIGLAVATTACASPTRALARGAVLTASSAVKVMDEECAKASLATGDLQLATQCADTYDEARGALLGTAHAVDAWDDAKTRGNLVCAVWRGTEAVKKLAEILSKRGVKVPPIVTDAIELRQKLGNCEVKS